MMGTKCVLTFPRAEIYTHRTGALGSGAAWSGQTPNINRRSLLCPSLSFFLSFFLSLCLSPSLSLSLPPSLSLSEKPQVLPQVSHPSRAPLQLLAMASINPVICVERRERDAPGEADKVRFTVSPEGERSESGDRWHSTLTRRQTQMCACM